MNHKKLALITGSSKGLGKAIVLELASCNIDVIVHYNTSKVEAQQTAKEIESLGVQAFVVQADFMKNDEIERFFEDKIVPILQKEERRLDILINNAGISGFSRLNQITGELFDIFFAINVKAPLLLMKSCFQHMNAHGRIVNVSSTTVNRPYEKMIVYGSSKAALNNITKAVIKDFGKKEITVNAIAPGFIPTDMNQLDVSSQAVRSFILKNTAIKRIGTPEDIAKLVGFLISKDAALINGQHIEISGGTLYQ